MAALACVQRDFVPATVDDGLLEVVALHDGWHTAAVMAKVAHAERLVQVSSSGAPHTVDASCGQQVLRVRWSNRSLL